MIEKKTISFIMNPISGTVKKSGIPALIEDTLDKSLFDHTVIETQYAGHAEMLAKQEMEKGTDIVVAVGGDGTVNEVARSLVFGYHSLWFGKRSCPSPDAAHGLKEEYRDSEPLCDPRS